jgi:hypothetical protein
MCVCVYIYIYILRHVVGFRIACHSTPDILIHAVCLSGNWHCFSFWLFSCDRMQRTARRESSLP